MKKLLYVALTLFCFACASDPQKEMEKQLLESGVILTRMSQQAN